MDIDDALERIFFRTLPSKLKDAVRSRIWIVSYIDDITIGGTSRELCHQLLCHVLQQCQLLGLQVNHKKTQLPTKTPRILGYIYDIPSASICLPSDKSDEICQLLEKYISQKKVKRSDLESLAGKLAFASLTLRPGMAVVRSTYNAYHSVYKDYHRVKLSKIRFLLADWKFIIKRLRHLQPVPIPPAVWAPEFEPLEISIYSDASKVGWGAVSSPSWTYGKWPLHMRELHITELETAALLLGIASFRRHWNRIFRLRIFVDNQTLQCAINKKSSRNSFLHHLIRALALWAASKRIFFHAFWIPSERNKLADHLSRKGSCGFLQLAKRRHQLLDLNVSPVIVPPELSSLLV